MSGNIRDEGSVTDGKRTQQAERYAALTTADTYIVYDRENHRAWLESDLSLSVEARR